MATAVRVQLMGPVRAWRYGAGARLRGVSARTVLARLALDRGTAVTVDALTDALWGADPPDNAPGNLHSVVSRLRRDLGADAIETTPSGYRLSTAVRTDLADLEAVLDQVDRMDPATAAERLRQVVSDWQGAPLDDVAETVALHPDRARLEELQRYACDRLSRLLLDSGLAEELIPELLRRAEAAPDRERTHMLLAEALARAGRSADALRVIRRYGRTLAEESGLEMSSAMIDLERAVLGDAFESTVPVSNALLWQRRRTPARWTPPDARLVGREAELATLESLAEGHRLVTVVGPGGVGKSRLLMELLVRRSEPPVVVLLASYDVGVDVATAIAVELGLEPSSCELLVAIVERLRMAPTTIVLDNCEHVLASARRVVAVLLRQTHRLTVLVSSRHRLGLPEEQLVHVEPLTLSADRRGWSPAVELFVERVGRPASPRSAEPRTSRSTGAICRLLGGLPLALELAASRVHLLGLEAVRYQLARRRSTGGMHELAMDAVVRWSLDLLSRDARTLFREICVLPATFDLDAVGAIASVAHPVAAFGELLDAALVREHVDDAHRTFRILEPIRQAGMSEAHEPAVRAYVAWVLDLAERIEAAWLDGQPADAIELLVRNDQHLRHASAMLEARGRVGDRELLASRIALPLAARPNVELVTSILQSEPTTPDGLVAHATLAWGVGRAKDALGYADRLFELVEASDPRIPITWWGVAPACAFAGDADCVARGARWAANHAAAPPASRAWMVACWVLGELYRGNVDRAEKLLDRHAATIAETDTGGFGCFVRAEVAARSDPKVALAWLERGSRTAARAGMSMIERMNEIARLALLVQVGESTRASAVARALVERLIADGRLAQAWTSLRHVATLLADAGEYAVADRVLAAASTSHTAPAGAAIGVDAGLHARVRDKVGVRPRAAPTSMGAGELWPEVEAALRGICGDAPTAVW